MKKKNIMLKYIFLYLYHSNFQMPWTPNSFNKVFLHRTLLQDIFQNKDPNIVIVAKLKGIFCIKD